MLEKQRSTKDVKELLSVVPGETCSRCVGDKKNEPRYGSPYDAPVKRVQHVVVRQKVAGSGIVHSYVDVI